MQNAEITIGGKTGVGKATVSVIWAQLLDQDGLDVLAIDADPRGKGSLGRASSKAWKQPLTE
ncbi:AAA family ATPase [Planctomycetota bacterium]